LKRSRGFCTKSIQMSPVHTSILTPSEALLKLIFKISKYMNTIYELEDMRELSVNLSF